MSGAHSTSPMPSSGADPFDLNRFVDAQRSSYAQAMEELRAGRKRSHWSWYVLPQLRGLGRTSVSVRYAITGLAEAEAYAAHPVLGARLHETIAALNAHTGLGADRILGSIDALKFRSCLTLFGRAEPASPDFVEALQRYFDGVEDPLTVALLAEASGRG